MKLHDSKEDFQDAVIAAASYYHVSPAIVEKDYLDSALFASIYWKSDSGFSSHRRDRFLNDESELS